LGSLDEFSAALETAEKSVALAREAGDVRQEASGLRRMAIAYMDQLRYAEALPLTEKALTLHRELGDRGEEINALNVLGGIHAWLWDQAASEQHLRQSHELAKASGYGFGTRAAAQNLFELFYQPRGEYEDWLRFVDTVSEAAQLSEDAYHMACCQVWRLRTLHVFGQHERALELVDGLILSADEIVSTVEQALLRYLRCVLLAELGDLTSARQTLGDAVRRARETGLEIYEIVMRNPGAYIALLEGDRDRMRAGLEQLLSGLDAVRATNEQQDIADWLDLAARLSLDLGEHERALEYSSEAMELLESAPNIAEPEVKLYSHARALLAAGQEAQAVEYLQSAYDRIMLVADNTQDETLRQSWLEKRTNRQILDLYRQEVAGG
jgi:tetratricopeptide (TPR) repeat protein